MESNRLYYVKNMQYSTLVNEYDWSNVDLPVLKRQMDLLKRTHTNKLSSMETREVS